MQIMIKLHDNNSGLEIRDLSLERGDTPILSAFNLSLSPGDMVWIKGSNGIGKTSFLKCCASLLRQSSGQILWNGVETSKQDFGYCAYLGHLDAHKPELTSTENLQFWQALYESPLETQMCLKKIGLWKQKDQVAKTLSAGQSRRLSLARLLLSNAPLWVLDEPAAVMDEKGRALIHDLLNQHIAANGCVLLASHGAPIRVGKHTRLLSFDARDTYASS